VFSAEERSAALLTSKGLVFTAHRVSNPRHSHGIESATAGKKLKGEDVYTSEHASRILGVDCGTIVRWVEAGFCGAAAISLGSSAGGCYGSGT
jgi:hypothetical protein